MTPNSYSLTCPAPYSLVLYLVRTIGRKIRKIVQCPLRKNILSYDMPDLCRYLPVFVYNYITPQLFNRGGTQVPLPAIPLV